LTEKLEADFRNLTQPKLNIANETDFDESKPLFTNNFDRSHEANFGNLSQPKMKLAKKREKPIFENERFEKNATAKKTDFGKPETLLETRNLILKTHFCQFETQANVGKNAKVFLARGCPTVCVTRVWVGVEKA